MLHRVRGKLYNSDQETGVSHEAGRDLVDDGGNGSEVFLGGDAFPLGVDDLLLELLDGGPDPSPIAPAPAPVPVRFLLRLRDDDDDEETEASPSLSSATASPNILLLASSYSFSLSARVLRCCCCVFDEEDEDEVRPFWLFGFRRRICGAEPFPLREGGRTEEGRVRPDGGVIIRGDGDDVDDEEEAMFDLQKEIEMYLESVRVHWQYHVGPYSHRITRGTSISP